MSATTQSWESDAVSVGQVHFGPAVVGLTAYLQKVGGLSYLRITRLLADWMGLGVARSTLHRALARLARRRNPPMKVWWRRSGARRWSTPTRRAGGWESARRGCER